MKVRQGFVPNAESGSTFRLEFREENRTDGKIPVVIFMGDGSIRLYETSRPTNLNRDDLDIKISKDLAERLNAGAAALEDLRTLLVEPGQGS